jgi:glycosyltransferase involved in cell wall biosynthesis
MNALLFTSKNEGFGLVIIEAMAVGVPVFAIKDTVIAELIIDKKNGLIIDSEDPEVIAQCMLENMSDAKLMTNIAEQSIYEVCQRFSLKSAAIEMELIYDSVLGVART